MFPRNELLLSNEVIVATIVVIIMIGLSCFFSWALSKKKRE